MQQQSPILQQEEVRLPEIDVMSDIFEKETEADDEKRMMEAIRISCIDRQEAVIEQPTKQEEMQDKQSGIHPDMLRLTVANRAKNGNEQQVKLMGVLQKLSPGFFGTWDSRYCALLHNKFVYRSNEKPDSQKAGILNFDLLSCYIELVQKNNRIEAFKIKIHQSEKEFVFRSERKQKTREWAEVLMKTTDESLGRKYKLTYLSHYHRFWRKDYFSEKDFREISETGDIILMRGINQSAVFQRVFTQQQYDHVAIVLKNIIGQVLIFQANGTIGVGIMPWKRFIKNKYYLKQQIVSYRKLHVERSEAFMNEIEDFVHRNMGRKYKFSFNKYLINRKSTNEDKSSYFCSSLVAKLYKNLQLLSDDRSSSQYRPSSFTESNNLKLRQDGKYGPARLGAEHIIVFEQQYFEKSP